ncbi:MAG: nitroreductase family protein [Candidatus Thorarchaeota archaeon]|nr:nitroreductase family protein [Candidatus Thorarchaeota archaeon]
MVEILEEIRKRRSGRAFDMKPIPQEMIDSIIEAGRWAPSCANKQAWNFVVLSDSNVLAKAHEALSRGNVWAKRAPVMILMVTKEDGGCSSHELPYFMMDIGLATQNMLLQAVHLGLLGHPTAGWNEEMLKDILSVPDEFRIGAVLFFGYEGRMEDLDERTQEKEGKPRTRKPLEELVHRNQW